MLLLMGPKFLFKNAQKINSYGGQWYYTQVRIFYLTTYLNLTVENEEVIEPEKVKRQ
jgi:hypothetical protein